MILEEIPLQSGIADQTVDIVLNETPYTLRITWNERFQYWSCSLFERDGDPIVESAKMVNNTGLLKRFTDSRLPNGDLFFVHKSGLTYRPTFDDIGGNTYGLFYFDENATLNADGSISIIRDDITILPPPESEPSTVWDGGMTIWDNGNTTWYQDGTV